MIDAILDFVHDSMSSPWIYLLIFAVAAVDGFFPVVPGESIVLTAGVYAAATGQPNIVLVIAAASVGAFAGDHVSYLLGRTAGTGLAGRLPAGTKRHNAYEWAQRVLIGHGGVILIISRYIPGGRTATTMVAGATRYPLRRFAAFDGIAAVSWGIYCALLGFVGGMAFENDPVKGLLLGFGLALAVTAVVELVRHSRKRRERRLTDAKPAINNERSPVAAPSLVG